MKFVMILQDHPHHDGLEEHVTPNAEEAPFLMKRFTPEEVAFVSAPDRRKGITWTEAEAKEVRRIQGARRYRLDVARAIAADMAKQIIASIEKAEGWNN